MPSVASTCVRSAGPPPVSRYTLLKSPSVQIIDRIVELKYSVRSDGQVTYLNFCHTEAPSTDAASYCSRGMARRPAIRIRVQNGSDFQMCVSMARPRPMRGSLSQFGPSAAVSLKITVFTTPHSGLNMKRIEKMVGIDGTAQGSRNSTDSQRIHTRSCTKKPDSHSASTNFRFTATTRKMMVLTTVLKKIGSANSLT